MTEPQKQSISVILVMIGAIALLEALAIWKGLDGKYFALVVAAICAIGGVKIGKILK